MPHASPRADVLPISPVVGVVREADTSPDGAYRARFVIPEGGVYEVRLLGVKVQPDDRDAVFDPITRNWLVGVVECVETGEVLRPVTRPGVSYGEAQA